MGVDRAPNVMCGLGYVDPRLEFWPEESGEYDSGGVQLSELISASPVAGLPSRSQVTKLALEARGSQTKDIVSECNRGGLPQLDRCGLVWKQSGDGDAYYRGCDLPVIPFRWETLQLSGTRSHPDVITCDDDTVVGCWWVSGTGVVVRRRALDGAWTAESTVVGDATATNPWATLLSVPEEGQERLHLYYWKADGTDWQVAFYHSSDRGVTWTYGGVVLQTSLDASSLSSVRRLRAAYANGQIMMVAHVVAADTATGPGVFRDRLVQWASRDGGNSFELVHQQDGSSDQDSGGWPDITVVNNQFLLARVRYDATAARSRAVTSLHATAFYTMTAGGEYSGTDDINEAGRYWCATTLGGAGVSDTIYTDGECACWTDDDGAVYLAGRHASPGAANQQICVLLRSADGGENWVGSGTSPWFTDRGQTWWWDENGNSYPIEFAVTPHRGRAILLHNFTSGGADQTKIAALYLGGWQTRPMPPNGGTLRPDRRTAWTHPQVSSAMPDAQGWTRTLGGGAPAPIMTNNRTVVTTGAGQTVKYDRTGALFTPAQGAAFEVALEVSSGAARVRIYAYDAAGPTRYASELEITSTTVKLFDINGGVQIGSTYNYSGGRIRVRLDQAGNDVLGIIFEGDDTLEDRRWEDVARGLNLTNAGAYTADKLPGLVAPYVPPE